MDINSLFHISMFLSAIPSPTPMLLRSSHRLWSFTLDFYVKVFKISCIWFIFWIMTNIGPNFFEHLPALLMPLILRSMLQNLISHLWVLYEFTFCKTILIILVYTWYEDDENRTLTFHSAIPQLFQGSRWVLAEV